MRVLLDTNIIIHRESVIIDPDIGKLFRWLDQLNYIKCIHPISIEEIEKHQDSKFVQKMKIKLDSYYVLKTQAPINDKIKQFIDTTDKTESDKNDSIFLNELLCERVDYLITEDGGIHGKANLLNLSHKVFTIDSFIEKVRAENPDFIDYKVPIVKKEYFGNININDTFFDSFKKDYGNENYKKWFNGKAEEIAYVCKSAERLIGFLYLKRENENEDYSDIDPVFSKKKRLKIGAFKVELTGLKIGERFLKIVFDNALRFRVDEIYVTIFNNDLGKQRLIRLLEDYGFEKYGKKTSNAGEEDVYVRDFGKKVDRTSPKKTFPYVSINTDIFIVSIRPEYHTSLLPDSILKTESTNDFVENEPFRNAISKVFVSRSIERNLKSGDIVVFYRTGGKYKGVVTTVGVVENIITDMKDEEQFVGLCRKRSVFSDKELKLQWNLYRNNKPFIVNFLYAYSLPKRINLERLIELGVIPSIDAVPRGFTKINKDAFLKIINETNADEGIIVY